MNRPILFFAVLVAASSLPQAVPGLQSLAYAASGGGGGTTPPPTGTVDSPNLFTPEVRGAVAGAVDGNLQLIFRLYELGAGCDEAVPTLCIKTLLFEEEKSVVIASRNFVTGLGSTTSPGLAPSLVAGKSRLLVQWFAPASPATSLGSYPMSSTPYALTLVPGAVVRNSSNVALELGNSDGAALSASVTGANANALRVAGVVSASTTSTAGGSALHGYSTAPSGSGYGVIAVTRSPQGRALNLLGEGDLIKGFASDGATEVFRVDAKAKVYLNGQKLPRKGPAGSAGADGANGSAGSPPSGTSSTFGVLTPTSACASVCLNGSILLGWIAAPCSMETSGGVLQRIASGGACCVCSSTRYQ